MRFVVGLNPCTGLGSDLERVLSSRYCISEFEIIGCACGPACTSTRTIAGQVDRILESLLGRSAQYFVGISSGRVEKNTPVGRVPCAVTVMTAIDSKGIVHVDRIEEMGHYLPLELRKHHPIGKPDLLDIICSELVGLAGTAPEPIRIQLP